MGSLICCNQLPGLHPVRNEELLKSCHRGREGETCNPVLGMSVRAKTQRDGGAVGRKVAHSQGLYEDEHNCLV